MAGRPKGAQNKDKPFAEALRMEIAAAGDNHKALRAIANNLIAQALLPSKDALPAIQQIADRLDGKPAQAVTVGGDADNPLQVEVSASKEQRDAAVRAALAAKS